MPRETLQERINRIIILQQYPVTGRGVKSLAQAGYAWLEANKQSVNALNVFPVPDGDTGTNMVLTMKSAIEEIKKSDQDKAGAVLEALANGALMGARGNSGVILSQIWRGFARSINGKQNMDSSDLARAFSSGRDSAYQGVGKPVEGTILTVIKDIAAAAEKGAKEGADPVTLLEYVVKAADESVRKTPEQLPILKEAGVVDAGGKGLYFLVEGMLRWARGEQLKQAESIIQPIAALDFENTMQSVEEGQDYEVVVDFKPNAPLDLKQFYADLEKMGTSIQLGEGQGMYRLHIHVPTKKRNEPIDYVEGLGTWTNIKMENLLEQMETIGNKSKGRGLYTIRPIAAGQVAVVAVAPGAGIAKHFADLGVAGIIEGGQTMNPSTADILAAFENLPTDKIIILPNNKNIVMAAKSAAEVTKKTAVVVSTTSVPQGLAAMLRWDPKGQLVEVAAEMKEAVTSVHTGEITTATRTVDLEGVKVKEGQIIGLHNGRLAVAAADVEDATLKLLKKMNFDKFEILTLFYGQDVELEIAEEVADAIRQKFPKQSVEVHEGGQPSYQFIFAIE